MPRRSLKPKKRLKVDTRVSPEEDAHRARHQRSLRHLESKPTAEQLEEEVTRDQAKALLAAGRTSPRWSDGRASVVR